MFGFAAAAEMRKFHLIKPIMVEKTFGESDEKFSSIIFAFHGFVVIFFFSGCRDVVVVGGWLAHHTLRTNYVY